MSWAGLHRRKLGSDASSTLWRTVIEGLRCRWPAEQIKGKLSRMNAAGARACAGRTWRDAFDASCGLQVIKGGEDDPPPTIVDILIDHVVEGVPCPASVR